MLPMTEMPTSDAETPQPVSVAPKPRKTAKSQLLGGSLTLLAGSGIVGITNLIYNVATARLLGPAGFSHVTAVYTILMLLSCITLSFQVVCAKYIARSESDEERSAIFAGLHQRALLVGVGIGLLMFLFAGPITAFLNLPDRVLIWLLALGMAFYIPLGVRRGYIQGTHAFGPLALNFMLEGFVRLGGAVLLIALGMGVKGTVVAIAAAVIAAYFAALPSPALTALSFRSLAISAREGVQAIVFFSGQTVINNFDIVLVKHFFPPAEAGFYAAVSLVGRVINMCAWSVVHTMFPVSAGDRSQEKNGASVLFMSLGLVTAILSVLIFGLWLVPGFLWKTLFGAHFELGGYGSLPQLLILYAITTGVYSLSSVIITHEMSRKVANTSWLQLAFSGAMAAGICLFHGTLLQVILVQLALMTLLLCVLLLPLLRLPFRSAGLLSTYPRLELRSLLTEEEVIAEFLRSEFHHPEFDEYRHEFDNLVRHPDLTNRRENAVRQALLFLRRGAMWRELPENTKWYEVELASDDLARVRFFPRANWRRFASGSFFLTDVMQRIRPQMQSAFRSPFLSKLRLLSSSVEENLTNPTILLIGIDRNSPLTILDGNHRMAAAMLCDSPAVLERLRFICGFSPDMTRCCWYSTNVNTLLRYLTNLIRNFLYDPQSVIGRFQDNPQPGRQI